MPRGPAPPRAIPQSQYKVCRDARAHERLVGRVVERTLWPAVRARLVDPMWRSKSGGCFKRPKRTILRPQNDPKTAPRRHLGTQDDPRGNQDGAQDEASTPQDDPRGRQDGTQDDQRRSKNRLEKRSPLRSVLRRSWADLGSILAPSWDQKSRFSIGKRNNS